MQLRQIAPALPGPGDGTVWVYNASAKRLVYTAALRSGQNVEVDPDHDFVTVDGKKVLDTMIDDLDKHQILFTPGSGSTTLTPSTPAPSNTTIVTAPPSNTTIITPPPPAPSGTSVTVQPAPAR